MMHYRCFIFTLKRFVPIVRLRNLHKIYNDNIKTFQTRFFCQGFSSYSAPRRCLTASAGTFKDISYEEVKKFMQNKDTLLIDVREPSELNDGKIPRTINIPLGELEQAFKDMSDDTFLKRYGHKKPDKDQVIIFSCRIGNRSKKAQLKASQLGYKRALNYSGGWTEWMKMSKS